MQNDEHDNWTVESAVTVCCLRIWSKYPWLCIVVVIGSKTSNSAPSSSAVTDKPAWCAALRQMAKF